MVEIARTQARTWRSRIRLIGALIGAFGLGSLVLLAEPAVAQDQIRIVDSGGSNELIPPPSPACDDVVFITEVSFDPAGNPIDIPRFGSTPDLTQVFDVPGFDAVPAGSIVLDEVITYDGHIGRAGASPQTQEQVYFEFLLAGVSQVRTPLTPDIPDGQRTNWLDVDMGTYAVPNGADTMRIHHVGGDPAEINSLVVSALCGRFEEAEVVATTTTAPPATTVAPTTTAAPVTTQPPATTAAPATTQPPATTAAPSATTSSVVETEVEGQVELPDTQLAATGVDHDVLFWSALASIVLGFGLVVVGSKSDVDPAS